ncbi:uncharacterized protein LOC128469305 [Spea bombifrons]|uniref:uncharacterized protein LOC128469305 n=1 Tax=Spea bombifrons TaxID=233779 RepID=UPI002349BCF2|nr:uncharacterized protein LOC128469305 [Spea bombifrons]
MGTESSVRLRVARVDNPGEVKGTEEAPTAHGGDLRHQRPTSGFLERVSEDPNKNLQSKLTVKTSPTGQVPRPTSLQLYKARSPNASAHQGATSSVASPHGHLPCKPSQKPMQTSRRSLGQPHNGSRSAGLKSPELTPNDCAVGRPPARVTSHTVSGSSKILHDTTDPVIKPESGPRVHSHEGTNSKLSTIQPPPCPSQVPTVELSKQAGKQSPRGSMLRPPSNFASKLKTPSSPKSDVLQPAESQADPSKSFQKAPSATAASPKPFPNRKENPQEATESSPSKKQSRLPQPKTH